MIVSGPSLEGIGIIRCRRLLTALPGLFIEMGSQSISFIYQVQGCQHVLVQPKNDTDPPSIPALTIKGFVRWQSIQILLEPQTHVPIMQFAVRNWALKNPDDGTPFPTNLPKEAFPLKTDADCDRWHQNCAVRLREQATPKEDPRPSFTEHKDGPKTSFSERKVPFAHVRVDPSSRGDYFGRVGGMAYVRVPDHPIPRGVPLSRSPEREKHRDRDWDRDRSDRFRDQYTRRHGSSSDEFSHRHRNHDHSHLPQETRSAHLPPRIPDHHPAPRRHSQPRPLSSSSDTEDDDAVSPTTRVRRRSHRSTDPPPISSRRFYGPDNGARVGSSHPHLPSIAIPVNIPENGRRGSRGDDPKRRSFFDLKEKVMSFLPVSGSADRERQRSGSRGRKDQDGPRIKASDSKERGRPVPRQRGSWSDYNSNESDSEESAKRRKHRKQEKEQDRERHKVRDTREREREKALARDRERSSHLKERPRDRDYDRDSDERRDQDRDRNRDRDRDSDERRDRDRVRDKTRDRAGPERSQRRSREPSDEDLPPKTRTRGSGGPTAYLGRPDDGFRRASSHADISRKRDWDTRDHDRPRDERYRDRDRERTKRDHSTRLPSPGTGVTGRVYPDIWN